jgi:YfiH family protein
MSDLISKFEKIFETRFIWPENFIKLNLPAFFSKKVPYSFDFKNLNCFNTFKFFFPEQIHSTHIIELVNNIPPLFSLKGDGVLTNQSNIFLGVKTADCVPVLVATFDKEYIGAVHAGWKGSVNKILQKFLQKILDFGYSPEEVFIAIGPHIKVCCYEVKEEVLEKLKKEFSSFEKFLVYKNNRAYLDLEKLNVYQAISLGIPESNIWVSSDCTYCLNEYYWSHRFHKEKRKFQVSIIGKVN